MAEDYEVPDWECFTSEVGKGWAPLCTPILEYIREQNEILPSEERIIVLMIKKWGGMLNIYVEGGGEELGNRIFQAEKRSQTTCEECGEDGEERPGNYESNIYCDKCWEECLRNGGE